MVRQKVDPRTRKALLDARKLMLEVARIDGNEAETRRRVERLFGSLCGYDVFRHLTREYAIHGVGNTEYCDFAIRIDNTEGSGPAVLVELKKVNTDLAPKHLKQAASYAIDLGCEWVLLTNGVDWRLYHISFGKPPQTTLVESWNLVDDDLRVLSTKFDLIGYKNVKKDGLGQLWQKSSVLTAQNMLKVILSDESIRAVARKIKRLTGVAVTPEEIVGAIRRLLNESARGEMDKIRISLPERKQRRRASAVGSGDTETTLPTNAMKETP